MRIYYNGNLVKEGGKLNNMAHAGTRRPTRRFRGRSGSQHRLNQFKAVVALTFTLFLIGQLHVAQVQPVDAQNVPEVKVMAVESNKVEAEPQKPQSVKDRIVEIAKQEGFSQPDVLKGIAWAETRLREDCGSSVRQTDKEYSVGCFQINLAVHKDISKEQASNLEFATKWTIARLVRKGFYQNTDRAICSHNGRCLPAYLATVKEGMKK